MQLFPPDRLAGFSECLLSEVPGEAKFDSRINHLGAKNMDLQQTFTDRELEAIVEEATIYMCACPGQVAAEIRGLRNLIRYQRDCINSGKTLAVVHQTIESSAHEAHVLMEACLERVLEIEGWDRQTLKMPAGLRKLRDGLLNES